MLDEKKMVKRYINFVTGFHKNNLPKYVKAPEDSVCIKNNFNLSLDDEETWDIVSKTVPCNPKQDPDSGLIYSLIPDNSKYKIGIKKQGEENVYWIKVPAEFFKNPDEWENKYMIQQLSSFINVKRNAVQFQEDEIQRITFNIQEDQKEIKEKEQLLYYLQYVKNKE